MCDHTMINRIRIEVIRLSLRVALIFAKLCEGKIEVIWSCTRDSSNVPVKRAKNITIDGKRRHKIMWEEQLRKDFSELYWLSKDLS